MFLLALAHQRLPSPEVVQPISRSISRSRGIRHLADHVLHTQVLQYLTPKIPAAMPIKHITNPIRVSSREQLSQLVV
jgi:hypothetical protein